MLSVETVGTFVSGIIGVVLIIHGRLPDWGVDIKLKLL
jgi:hypothetical protein